MIEVCLFSEVVVIQMEGGQSAWELITYRRQVGAAFLTVTSQLPDRAA